MTTTKNPKKLIGFRAGDSTQIIKYYIDNKLNVGKTNRQELINDIVSTKKGIFILREKYIRDVIQMHQKLGLLDLYVPHTEEYTLPKEDFLHIAKIEMPDIYSNIGNPENIPDIVILLREPTSKELSTYSLLHFRRYYWSLIFHGEIHKIQMQWEKENHISDYQINAFIEDIGRNIFEEIRYVLFHENLLFDQNNDREVFYEFIAYFLQFYNFAPQSLVKIFPILTNYEQIYKKIVDLGFDVEHLLAHSRPNNSVSVEELIIKREYRLKDPNPDLPIFETRYHLDKIYESPQFQEFFGASKAKFRQQYGNFIEEVIDDIIDYNGIIGRCDFKKLHAKAFRKNIELPTASLLQLDVIFKKQLKAFYTSGSYWQRKIFSFSPQNLLKNEKYRMATRKNIEKVIPKMEKDQKQIAQKAGKVNFLAKLLLPLWLVWQIVLIIPRLFYPIVRLFQFRSPRAQKAVHKSIRRKYRNSLRIAYYAKSKGNMARAFMEFKKCQRHISSVVSPIEIPKNTPLYQEIHKEAKACLESIQEEFAKEYQYSDKQRSELEKFFDHIIKLDPLQHMHRRLLQDIQKSYVDSRRVYFKVSFFGWLFTLGRKSFKTPLPALSNLKKIRSLRAIQKRIYNLQLRKYEINLLINLMQSTFENEENRIREHYRPLLEEAFVQAGLHPKESDGILSQRESVALYKMQEEVLDLFVDKGYVHMTDLRDIISRNQLKMNDLRSPQEFILGDQLLRLDKKIDKVLLGVHHRGEIYMRMIHRVSSLLFGFSVGRWCAKYIATPFGGAYALIEMCLYIGKKFGKLFKHEIEMSAYRLHTLQQHYIYPLDQKNSTKPILVMVIGFALLFFFYTKIGRRTGKQIINYMVKLLRLIFIKIPKWLWFLPPIQFLYKLTFWRFLNIFVFRPALYTCPITLPIVYFTNLTNYLNGYLFVLFGIALGNLVINTSLGRNIFDYLEDRLMHFLYEFNRTVFVGMFHLIVEGFSTAIQWIERVLYAVDDFFRFRQGENVISQVAKAIFGKIWFAINYLFRFTINLIAEPQINPIKHFPIVTISHKIILPFSYPLTIAMEETLIPILGDSFLLGVGMTIVFLFIQFGMPGICGFMAWEFKENWKLYEYSNSQTVKPVIIGSHGETIPRFLKTGFHSGTIPKLYKKIRKDKAGTAKLSYSRKIEYEHHHICHDLEKFISRSFCSQFNINTRMRDYLRNVKVGHAAIRNQSITIPVTLYQKDRENVTFKIIYELQSDLICSYIEGDLSDIHEELKNYVLLMLIVVWKESAVDTITDQMEQYIAANLRLDEDWYALYSLDEDYLVLKVYSAKALIPIGEITYNLGHEEIKPRVSRAFSSQTTLPSVRREDLLIKFRDMSWENYDSATKNFLLKKDNYTENTIPEFLHKAY
ncbi:hypothetical protein [Candidatus Uabimicrobium amorphum]|uniref:Uncharacterized protein n=1 Tax=Uabimicrobium amorphum TaxID=2596890 RepID=A0A5S9IUK9_UABAM|nr:hypothetical protein [Candidatus Uabimicrobium amorphum]BBM87866.1 hypothetical protein UABAM_06281 [Candidatus Uabimicrobium amorphum]